MHIVASVSESMEISEACRRVPGGVEVDVQVSPNASKPGIGGVDEWRKRVVLKVRAPPVDGKANKEVETLLSKLSGGRARVTSGLTSRQKTVLIEGDQEDIWLRMTGKS